jgi:hypothetical protein
MLVVVLAALVASVAMGGETPVQMRENVVKMTEPASMLDIFLSSSEYRDLADERALEFNSVRQRLASLVERIGETYGDEVLVLAFEVMCHTRKADPDILEYYESNFAGRPDALYAKALAFVDENEKIIGKYLDSQAKKRR